MTCFEINWDDVKKNVIKRSLSLLDTELRWGILRHLKNVGEDTIYGISKRVGKTIPSVIKTIKPLEGKYIVSEKKPSFRRKREASVYKLTDLGEIAIKVINAPNVQITPYTDIMKYWVYDDCLKDVFLLAMFSHLELSNLEENIDLLREIVKLGNKSLEEIIASESIRILAKALSLEMKKHVDEKLRQLSEQLDPYLLLTYSGRILREVSTKVVEEKRYEEAVNKTIEYWFRKDAITTINLFYAYSFSYLSYLSYRGEDYKTYLNELNSIYQTLRSFLEKLFGKM
jgi:predicted transcriptional regulator